MRTLALVMILISSATPASAEGAPALGKQVRADEGKATGSKDAKAAKPAKPAKAAKAKDGKDKATPAPKAKPQRPVHNDAALLAAIPERASKSFMASAKENRDKADAVFNKVLRALKATTSWTVDPANTAQVTRAVARIEGQRKQLEAAKGLYAKAAKHARLVHSLAIKAARIRGLAEDKDADVSVHAKKLAELEKGERQRKDAAKVKALDLLAQALADYIRGKMAAAIIQVENSIKVDGKIALAHVFKGSLCYLTGDRVRAKEAWTEALRINPNNREIRRALIQIGGTPPPAPSKPRKKKPRARRRRR